MSFCAAPSKITAPTQAARPARALVVRCEASAPVNRAKQIGAALLSSAVIATASPVFAADLANGADVFNGNCAACHAGGGNSVIAERTLKKDAVEKYLEGGYTADAIMYQVRNGKGGMPAWEDRLEEDEIQDVVAYVYKKIGEGW